MRLAVLETGGPPGALKDRFPSYSRMFRDLLGEDFAWAAYDVMAGHWPSAPEDHDGYIVTGSPAGVYEPDPWIADLLAFLNRAKGRAKLVGVCFGHQAMAQAFGGKVVKSPNGWGVGLHVYRVTGDAPWMHPPSNTIAVPASHQDQVVELPPGARVLAGSEFTPFGVLDYADQAAISIQLHPEFEPDYAKALIQSRRGTRFSDAEADAAIASLDQHDDRALVGDWIRRFLVG